MRQDGFKRWAAAAGAACLCGAALAQQVDVSVTLAYNVFVYGEPVLVQLEALNATRDPLAFGAPGARDALLVEITKGGPHNQLAPLREGSIVGELALKPGQAVQQKVELDKWFPLLEEGKYLVRLAVVHDGARYVSSPKSFDVVPGIPVKDGVQMFVNRQNQKRLFKLVRWSRNQAERLFLRAEDDPSGKVWDSIDLGVLMRQAPPKLDISPEGEVTVVHRATQDAFIRTVLWSLPDSLEVVERDSLLDPEISASQRVRTLYGEMADGDEAPKKPWWKFW